MNHYLAFDAGCSACSSLAHKVQDVAAGKLSALNIHEEPARSLLDRAHPRGWRHAPYLITVDRGRVRAWTGLRGVIRLGAVVGPRKAWQIWSLAVRSGVRTPPGMQLSLSRSATRRHALKVGAAALAAAGWFGLRTAAPAEAQECICPFLLYGYCTPNCGGGYQYQYYVYDIYRHYGTYCASRCWTTTDPYGCSCL